ncbi:hypothetical protein V1506DRAFT_194561 [Lipomyces tetrasporus]
MLKTAFCLCSPTCMARLLAGRWICSESTTAIGEVPVVRVFYGQSEQFRMSQECQKGSESVLPFMNALSQRGQRLRKPAVANEDDLND